MEDIPDVGTTFIIHGIKVEIVKTLQRTVKIARLSKDDRNPDSMQGTQH